MFATAFQYVRIKAMASKGDTHFNLDDFFQKVGLPTRLISDNAPELTKGEFLRKAKRAQVPIHQVEVNTQNANLLSQ